MTRRERIVEIISSMENIVITSPLEERGEVITGAIQATVDSVSLPFKILIRTAYPLQFHNSETIHFFNEELNEYDHVMKNGFICIHTTHSPDLVEKLMFDFNSLKEWIKRFYINKESEIHYEHIVIPPTRNETYFFTNVPKKFNKNDYGTIKYSKLAKAKLHGADSTTYLVQQFVSVGSVVKCDWSSVYQELPSETGVYVFIEDAPVVKRKFAIENWLEFESILEQAFLGFLFKFQRQRSKRGEFPLLIGYRISSDEIHWQVIYVKDNDPPISGKKIPNTKNYIGKLKSKPINWAQSRNCSYQYFFGRGALSHKITDSNILIIGIGAVGSMVAKSLVQGGCKRIMLTDHDKKEPENVCRSEYTFRAGVTTKVQELSNTLTSISPFVEVSTLEVLMDAAKIFVDDDKHSKTLLKLLSEYDIIFDCSTDDDVAYVLERYKVRAQVFNLSITNQATELICVVSPNLYEWMKTIFKKFTFDAQDLYNPTGCWNPTFKASHNDIAVLVQFALKQVNLSFKKGIPFRNFYLSTSDDEEFKIKLNQF